MALTPEQIKDEASHHGFIGNTDQLVKFARAIEAEARKDDTELIRQLVEALENFDDAGPVGEGWQSDELVALLKSARARLDGK